MSDSQNFSLLVKHWPVVEVYPWTRGYVQGGDKIILFYLNLSISLSLCVLHNKWWCKWKTETSMKNEMVGEPWVYNYCIVKFWAVVESSVNWVVVGYATTQCNVYAVFFTKRVSFIFCDIFRQASLEFVMSNVFQQLMNQPFPTMFKSPPGENNGSGAVAARSGSQTGQKVVCTPEVSLYQYSNEMAAAVAAAGHHHAGGGALQRIMEEKGLVGPDAGVHGGASPVMQGANGMNGGTVLPGPNGGFSCNFCGKTFMQKNTFQNHLRSHREGDDPYQCDICGKTFAGKKYN